MTKNLRVMANEQAQPGTAKRGGLHWPQALLGPPPGLKELNVICWGLFFILLVLPACAFLWLRIRTGAKFEDILPIDFIYFYGIGQLVLKYPVSAYYDLTLQLKEFSGIYTLTDAKWGGSPYPPFVMRFFSLYARFSLEKAYFLWMGTSLALYLGGLAAILKVAFPADRVKRSLMLWFALVFPPFLYFTWIVGQLATVAMFAVSLAIYLESRQRLFASGLALALLIYKPTLLVLIVPMLLLTRRRRTLYGFLSGVGVLIALSTAMCGVGIWPAYFRFLTGFSHVAGVYGQTQIKRWDYVDFSSLSYLVPGGRSAAGIAVLVCVAVASAAWLATMTWRSCPGSHAQRLLLWAVVLTWTLLLNVYVPIYDTVLVVPALALTLAALPELRSNRAPWFVALALLVLLTSVFTEGFARRHNIQLMSASLLAFALLQAATLQQALGKKSLRAAEQ